MEIVDYVKSEKERLKKLISESPKIPGLAILQVGDNPASNSYIKGKIKDSEEVGIKADLFKFPVEVEETEILNTILRLNDDKNYDGILLQLPIPKHLNEQKLVNAINPEKDVDGFTLGSHFTPCTPKGIIDYLTDMNFPFEGKNAVVIGRSNIVGKPLAKLLLQKNMNVTVLHSKTKEEDKRFYAAHADLLVSAVGHINIIDHTYTLKPSAVLIDVGINRDENNKLIGDMERNLPVSFQSPVPKGVGLLTRLALLKNLWEATLWTSK